MPNWCYNRVSVYSENTKDIDELFDIFNNENPFNALIPSPKWSETPNEDGELPVLEEHKDSDGKVLFTTHKFPKSGKTDDRWYDWQIQNWGTKWEPADLSVEQCEQELELTFNTAWSPPEDICRAIRNKYPDCSVSWFYDEPGCEIAGYL
tara:strand:+ start:115 stop:564 length:450 start_codon:yes stop_codon:yes gene_type:complete